jgi:hypothetical protein
MRKNTSQDVRWGLKWGIAFGICLALYTLIVYLAAGDQPFHRVGASPLTVLGVYILGSLAAGAIVGLLRPLTKERDGAMLVGVLAAMPASFVINLTMFGPPNAWSAGDWFQFVVLGAMFGAVLGFLWHRPP